MTEFTTNTTPAEIVTAAVGDVEDLQVAEEVNLEEECKEEEGVNRDLSSTNHSKTKRVNFGLVEVREYCITIGNSPYCSCGPPLSLDWEYSQLEPYDIDTFECALKRKMRSRRRLLLDPMQRRLLLWRSGHTIEDIDKATKQNEKEKFRQSVNLFFLPIHMVQEFFVGFRGKQKSRESERTMVEAQVRQLHQRQLADVDTEHGGLTPWQQEMRQRQRPERRLSFRRSGSQASLRQGLSQSSQQSDGESSGGGPGIPDLSSRPSMDEDEASMGSTQSQMVTYNIRTDPRQHDKATEIIICSFERPHMRAFHASWFGFFIGKKKHSAFCAKDAQVFRFGFDVAAPFSTRCSSSCHNETRIRDVVCYNAIVRRSQRDFGVDECANLGNLPGGYHGDSVGACHYGPNVRHVWSPQMHGGYCDCFRYSLWIDRIS